MPLNSALYAGCDMIPTEVNKLDMNTTPSCGYSQPVYEDWHGWGGRGSHWTDQN